MFFTECARLAERHPDLAGAVQQVDAQLAKICANGVIRAADLASILKVDLNQVNTVLEKLAHEKLLLAEEMVECPHCRMAALLLEYRERMEEDGEYWCTSCDRLLADATVKAITTYRFSERWQEISNPSDTPIDGGNLDASSLSFPANTVFDAQAYYTHVRLAEIFNVEKEALRKRLDRYRVRRLDGWKVNEDRRPNEPKYLYMLNDVRGIITELQASSQRPAK